MHNLATGKWLLLTLTCCILSNQVDQTTFAESGKTNQPRLYELSAPDHHVQNAQFMDDGRTVVTSGVTTGNLRYGKIILWDAATGKLREVIKNPEPGYSHTGPPVVSPDNRLMLINTGYKNDYQWLLRDLEQQKIIQKFKAVKDCVFSPDSRLIHNRKQILDLQGKVIAEDRNWTYAHWTADNRLIWGRVRSKQDVTIDDPLGKVPPQLILDEERRFDSWSLMGDGKTVLAITPRNDDIWFQYYDIEDGKLLLEHQAPAKRNSSRWYTDNKMGNGYSSFFNQTAVLPFSSGRDLLVGTNCSVPCEIIWKEGKKTAHLFRRLQQNGAMRLTAHQGKLSDNDISSHSPVIVGSQKHLLLCHQDWPQYRHWEKETYLTLVSREDDRIEHTINLSQALGLNAKKYAGFSLRPNSLQLSESGNAATFAMTHIYTHQNYYFVIWFGESLAAS